MAHEIILEIVENNEWRDGEFAKMRANLSNVEPIFWARLCIPLIYAHWEGFVVDSLKTTLKYLNSLELKADKVLVNLVVLGLSDCYQSFSGKQSFEQRIEFTNKFKDLLAAKIKFHTKIETKSNLKSKVLEDLCEIFTFDFSKFSVVSADIDRLVNIRNAIAHGENSISPDMGNVDKYIKSVKSAMDLLTNEIDVFLRCSRFLNSP